MNREQYLSILSRKIKALPAEEYESAMAFYTEYFDEAQSEQEAISKLPHPKQVAAKLLLEFGEKEKKFPVSIIVLAVLSAPIAFPLAIAALCVVFAFAVTVFSLAIAFYAIPFSFFATFVALMVGVLPAMAFSPATGILYIGLSLLFISLCYFTLILCNAAIKAVYKLIRKLILSVVKRGV